VVTVRPPGARTIDEVLAAARARLPRLTPREACRPQPLASGQHEAERGAAEEEDERPGHSVDERDPDTEQRSELKSGRSIPDR
jgi:hypothetical protein